jgi:hypothetical protein
MRTLPMVGAHTVGSDVQAGARGRVLQMCGRVRVLGPVLELAALPERLQLTRSPIAYAHY